MDFRLEKRSSFRFQRKFHYYRINLADVKLEALKASTEISNDNNRVVGKIAGVKTNNSIVKNISLAPGECEIYDVYTVVPHQCSTFDWPGSCQWEADGLTLEDVRAINGPGAHLPYYSLERTTEVNCAPPGFPSPPSGGGGGGATTPNPPGGYDPCDCGTGTPKYLW
jgi:hypothetical protein